MTSFTTPFPSRSRAVPGRAARLLLLGLFSSGLAVPVFAEDRVASNLADLSLEQLANVEVTSVSRRAERLSDAAASVSVLTAETLRRSGVTTLPEALRLVSNLEVARADANQYAISARGFNSVLANKMLVMIDGRTVYSPLFSGVFWEAQDLPLADVDRIEVISGPGGTLWGTNAVTGVINVITRSARVTHGVLAAAGTGDETRVGLARYGGVLGRGFHYRLFGKLSEQEHSELVSGPAVRDESRRRLGGFRADWGDSANDYSLQGGLLRTNIDQAPSERIVTGGYALGLWSWRSKGGAATRVQVYYDRSERDQPGAIHELLDTWDIDFQNGIRLGDHNVLWGAGYRFQDDRVDNLSPGFALLPGDRDLDYAHVFVEDGITLRPRLDLILGLKLERNDYTGFEYLPTVRLAWKPNAEHLLWTAASRAVRAPARIDREFFSPAAEPHFLLNGGPDFRSEIANVLEAGYRAQPTPWTTLTATANLSGYERLRSIELRPGGPQFVNGIEGTTAGLSVTGSHRINAAWRLGAGFFTQRRDLRLDSGALNAGAIALLGSDPSQWWIARSMLDLGTRIEFDLIARRIGSLPSGVPAYSTLDGRLAYRLLRDLELSLTGKNLVGPRHVEWGSATAGTAFGRILYVQLRWRT